MQLKRISLFILVVLGCGWANIGSVTYAMPTAAAPIFANSAFQQLWQYSDKVVAEVPGAGRSFTWGPNVFGTLQEDYVEGTGGKRQVEYFDKSRMELGADGKLVTNGLLTKELVTGNRQDGNNKYTQLAPSPIQIAGDDNGSGGNQLAPTYASFNNVVSLNPGQNRADDKVGGSVRLTIDHTGTVGMLPIGTGTATIPTILTAYEPVFSHNIPKAFVDFMQLTGKVWNGTNYLTGQVYTANPTANVLGYAISEPYWTQAVVAGKPQPVMVQLFERRVLTYTASNPVGFQVEMGNIGQHYYQWRYGSSASKPLTYVALGASDVVGVGADNPASDSWVVKLYQLLPSGTKFVRLGISGAKLADTMSQLLPQALAANPTLVTDWNVVNDLNDYLANKLTPDVYKAQLDNFLSQLVTKTSAPIFLGNVPDLTPVPIYARLGFGAAVLQAAQQRFNTIISTIAAKYPTRVHIVDLAGWDLKSHPEWISAQDGFHPSTQGYVQLAHIFYLAITATGCGVNFCQIKN